MFEIIKLNKLELSIYIKSERFLNAPVLPISEHRALSQIKNPKALKDDVLLLLTYDNEKLIGYLGILPDDIFLNETQSIHCGWMSCLWVDPNYRGKKIAQNLIHACFESWKGNILLTEYTGPAEMLYIKMGLFTSFKEMKGVRYYVRSDLSTLLPPKRIIFDKIKPILKSLDWGINILIDTISYFRNPLSLNYSAEEINKIDSETNNFISPLLVNQNFKRSENELNWIMQNPWVLSSDIADEKAKKYHFTSTSRKFEITALKIRNQKSEMLGFIILTNRDGHLKIPYCFYIGNIDAIQEVVNNFIKENKIKTVSIYQPSIIEIQKRKPFIKAINKSITRKYLISTSLSKKVNINNIVLQDGDGDCAFT